MRAAVLGLAGALALTVAAVAEPGQSGPQQALERIQRYLWPRQVVPVPTPRPAPDKTAAKPVRPAPEVQQDVPAQKEVMPHQHPESGPHRTKPASADQERPAQAPRKVKLPPEREPAPKRQPQQPGCTPITVDCAQICKYAYLGEKGGEELAVVFGYCRPTPAQRAAGKACIRHYCPQALTK